MKLKTVTIILLFMAVLVLVSGCTSQKTPFSTTTTPSATATPAQSGDIVYVDVTLKDELGRTVFTTNQSIYKTTLEKGTAALQASPMTITVNSTTQNLLEPIPAYLPATGQVSFAFLGPEYNQIAAGLVGMREGETKYISFIQNQSFQRELSQDQLAQIGGNFITAKEGDLIILGLTTNPMINTDNPQYALRFVTLKNKTDTTITMSYGYSGADVTILKFSSNSQTTIATPRPDTIPVTQATAALGIQVNINYPGSWQGSIGIGSNIRSVSGSGPTIYDITFPSGTTLKIVTIYAQKMDDSSQQLQITILDRGQVVASENTKAPYGVAMTSTSF